MNKRIDELYINITTLIDKYFKAMKTVEEKRKEIKIKVDSLSPAFNTEKDKVLNKLKEMLNDIEKSWYQLKTTAKAAYLTFNIDDYSLTKTKFNYMDPLKSLTSMVDKYNSDLKSIKSAYDITPLMANNANSLIYLLRNYINDFDSLVDLYWNSGKADSESSKILDQITKIEDGLISVVNDIFVYHDEIKALIDEENSKSLKEVEKTYKNVNEFVCPIFFKLGYKKKVIKEYKFESDDSLNLDDFYLYDYEEAFINLDETKETNDAVMFVLDEGVDTEEIINILMENAFISYPKEYVSNMIINSLAKGGELKALIDSSIADNLALYNMDHFDNPVKIPFAYIKNPEYLLCDNEYASDKAFLFYFVNKGKEEPFKNKMTHLYYVSKKRQELIAVGPDHFDVLLKEFR